MDWAYWSVTASLEAVFRPMGDGTYEVIILVSLHPGSSAVPSGSHDHIFTVAARHPASRHEHEYRRPGRVRNQRSCGPAPHAAWLVEDRRAR